MRYLMNQVTEEERARFEELYAADEEVLQELLSLENDIVDAYASGRLSKKERDSFQKRYLISSERRAKTEFAQALLSHIEANSTGVTGGPQGKPTSCKSVPLLAGGKCFPLMRVAAVVAFLIAGLGGVLTYRYFGLRTHSGQQPAIRQNGQQQPIEKASGPDVVQAANLTRPEREPGRQEQGTLVASLLLTSQSLRGSSQQNTVSLAPGVSLVRVELVLERNDYSSYDVFLRTAEGNQLWKKKNVPGRPLSENGSTVQLELPAAILHPDVYVLKLVGRTANGTVEDVAAYAFTVTQH